MNAPKAACSAALLACASPVLSQGRIEDYQRAERFLAEAVKGLVYDGQVDPRWISGSSRFWYLKDGPAGKEFLLVDADTGSRTPAFDHERLAASLSGASKKSYAARALPFDAIRFPDGGHRSEERRVGKECR